MQTTETPTLQEFHIEGVKHIKPQDAYELIKNNQAFIIDVRENDEIAAEGIEMENVLSHPMSVILDRIPFISKDQQIILACPGGVRSAKVANLLNRFDFPEVANLDGGLTQWKLQGLPYKVHSNLTISAGCGCGCSTSDGSLLDSKSCC